MVNPYTLPLTHPLIALWVPSLKEYEAVRTQVQPCIKNLTGGYTLAIQAGMLRRLYLHIGKTYLEYAGTHGLDSWKISENLNTYDLGELLYIHNVWTIRLSMGG